MRTCSIIGLLVALALAGAGCGDDDGSDSGSSDSGQAAETKTNDTGGGASDTGGAAAQTLKLTADPGGALKFDKSTLTAKTGKATIVLDNPSSLPHAVEVEGQGIEEETDTIGKGETAKVTVDLKPGEYEYYCPVDGHKAGGMTGKLTVQ
jgi:plastocyanin